MKKILFMCGLVLISMFMFTGCSSYKSYTYNVETGDKIKIKLETNDGYDMTSSLPFAISKDGQKLSQGTFITLEGYNQYISIVNSDSNAKILDSGSKNGVTYTFYSYNDSEFNYIIKVDNSDTGMVLANAVSSESAKECFDRLKISKE